MFSRIYLVRHPTSLVTVSRKASEVFQCLLRHLQLCYESFDIALRTGRRDRRCGRQHREQATHVHSARCQCQIMRFAGLVSPCIAAVGSACPLHAHGVQLLSWSLRLLQVDLLKLCFLHAVSRFRGMKGQFGKIQVILLPNALLDLPRPSHISCC